MKNKITQRDILDVFSRLGIGLGDTLFAHSFVGAFGPFENGLSTVVDSFKDIVGEKGTLIFPTYNFDFFKGGVFDITNTPSESGILTEHFRKLPGVSRTHHPCYSHAVYGEKERYFMKDYPSIIGRSSFFESLLEDDAKIVLFGMWAKAITLTHHVECIQMVPYRFFKKFTGDVNFGQKVEKYQYDHYCRIEGVALDFEKIEKCLLNEKILKREVLGRGYVSTVKANDFYRFFNARVHEDKEFLIKK